MNIHEDMSDNEVLRAAADTLFASPIPAPPEAGAIMARGRASRRRRLAGIALAGTAGTGAAALGLTSVLAGGPTPAQATGKALTVTGTASNATGTIRTAAFTLVKNTNGTVKLTLTNAQMFNPGVLQQALAKDGIPALVKIGAYCSSHPAPEVRGVISLQFPDGTPVPGPAPAHQRQSAPRSTVTVLNPAAMPAGTELAFGYFNNDHALAIALIRTDSYTCVDGPPPA